MKRSKALDFSTALLGLIKGSPLFSQFENAINKVIEGYRISKIDGVNQSQFLQTKNVFAKQPRPMALTDPESNHFQTITQSRLPVFRW